MAPPAQSNQNFMTRKVGPLPVWGWIVALIVGYYLYKRYTGSASATSASTTAGYIPPPTETVSLPGGYSYSGPAQTAPSWATTGAVAPGQGGTGTSPGSGGGTPGTQPSGGGGGSTTPQLPPEETIGGQQYYVLGVVPPSGQPYTGYEVAGGAPVYGGNANAIAQGTAAVTKPGNVLYTPAGYGNLIYGGPSNIPNPVP